MFQKLFGRGGKRRRKEDLKDMSSHNSYPGVTVAWWTPCSSITLRGNRTQSWTKGVEFTRFRIFPSQSTGHQMRDREENKHKSWHSLVIRSSRHPALLSDLPAIQPCYQIFPPSRLDRLLLWWPWGPSFQIKIQGWGQS